MVGCGITRRTRKQVEMEDVYLQCSERIKVEGSKEKNRYIHR